MKDSLLVWAVTTLLVVVLLLVALLLRRRGESDRSRRYVAGRRLGGREHGGHPTGTAMAPEVIALASEFAARAGSAHRAFDSARTRPPGPTTVPTIGTGATATPSAGIPPSSEPRPERGRSSTAEPPAESIGPVAGIDPRGQFHIGPPHGIHGDDTIPETDRRQPHPDRLR